MNFFPPLSLGTPNWGSSQRNKESSQITGRDARNRPPRRGKKKRWGGSHWAFSHFRLEPRRVWCRAYKRGAGMRQGRRCDDPERLWGATVSVHWKACRAISLAVSLYISVLSFFLASVHTCIRTCIMYFPSRDPVISSKSYPTPESIALSRFLSISPPSPPGSIGRLHFPAERSTSM